MPRKLLKDLLLYKMHKNLYSNQDKLLILKSIQKDFNKRKLID